MNLCSHPMALTAGVLLATVLFSVGALDDCCFAQDDPAWKEADASAVTTSSPATSPGGEMSSVASDASTATAGALVQVQIIFLAVEYDGELADASGDGADSSSKGLAARVMGCFDEKGVSVSSGVAAYTKLLSGLAGSGVTIRADRNVLLAVVPGQPAMCHMGTRVPYEQRPEVSVLENVGMSLVVECGEIVEGSVPTKIHFELSAVAGSKGEGGLVVADGTTTAGRRGFDVVSSKSIVALPLGEPKPLFHYVARSTDGNTIESLAVIMATESSAASIGEPFCR